MNELSTGLRQRVALSPAINGGALLKDVVKETQSTGVAGRELMAPGHLYNLRTGTGIEWLPSNTDTREQGKVRLWVRQWNGQPTPTMLAEAAHDTGSAWEYWYNLEFANSFPQVTHWWFGDAWTGPVCIWAPDAVEHDPESNAPMLTGWLRFGHPDRPALPWSVVLTSPPRVNIPFPPMAANVVNLPLQLLMAEKVMEALAGLTERARYEEEVTRVLGKPGPDLEIIVTSLVRREDLYRAFSNQFGPWRLDKLPDLTPREALCRVQGLEREFIVVAGPQPRPLPHGDQ